VRITSSVHKVELLCVTPTVCVKEAGSRAMFCGGGINQLTICDQLID